MIVELSMSYRCQIKVNFVLLTVKIACFFKKYVQVHSGLWASKLQKNKLINCTIYLIRMRIFCKHGEKKQGCNFCGGKILRNMEGTVYI